MNSIEFKKYTFWPDIKKMNRMLQDNYDFIGFCFELSTIDEQQKNCNVYFAGYFFLDFHDDEKNISFEIANIENQTGDHFVFGQNTQKSSHKKSILFENGCSKVNMKLEPSLTTLDTNLDFNAMMQSFINKDIQPHFNLVKQFLQDHGITYEKDRFDECAQGFCLGAQTFFSDTTLPSEVVSSFERISIALEAKKLDAQIAESDLKKHYKI